MKQTFIEKVSSTILQYSMIDASQCVIAAISGGKDSIAMLYALHALQTRHQFKLSVIHVNHMLRGDESLRDAAFVSHVASGLNIRCIIKKINTRMQKNKKKRTIQETARDIRYEFFLEVIKNAGGGKVALGHTKDDQAETILMRMFRGSGLKGLTGIPPTRNGTIIRPLINTSTQEVEQFVTVNKIKWVEDSSNSKLYYLRNSIRLTLIPEIIKNYNPNIVSTLTQTGDILRNEEDFINRYCESVFSKLYKKQEKANLVIGVDKIINEHTAIKRRLIRKIITFFTGSTNGITLTHVDNIISLIKKKKSGKMVTLPNNLFVIYTNNLICLSRINDFSPSVVPFSIDLLVPGKTSIPCLGGEFITTIVSHKDLPARKNESKDKYTTWCDLKKTGTSLFVRQRLPGDRFSPLGMTGEKKIKDFFIDEKVPFFKRDAIPLIVNDNKVICWVTGMRLSEKVKVSSDTKEVLIIQYNQGKTRKIGLKKTSKEYLNL